MEHILVIDNGKLLIAEDTDVLRGRAFTVTGQAAKVETFTAEKEVIDRTPLGGFVSDVVMGKLNTEDRKQAELLGLELTPVSLQQLIVHLTGGKTQGRVAKAQ